MFSALTFVREQQIKHESRKLATVMTFAQSLVRALTRLRNADAANEGITLSVEEVKAVVQAFRLLRDQQPKKETASGKESSQPLADERSQGVSARHQADDAEQEGQEVDNP